MDVYQEWRHRCQQVSRQVHVARRGDESCRVQDGQGVNNETDRARCQDQDGVRSREHSFAKSLAQLPQRLNVADILEPSGTLGYGQNIK